jgi:hypothetical protein
MLTSRLRNGYSNNRLENPEIFYAELTAVFIEHSPSVGDAAIKLARRKSPEFMPSVGAIENAIAEVSSGDRKAWEFARRWEENNRISDEERRQLEAPCDPERFARAYAEFATHFKRPTAPPETAEQVRAKYGLTAEQWNAMPNGTVKQVAERIPDEPKKTYCGTQGDGGPGTVYSNYDEAVRRHGRPYGRFEEGRQLP